MFHTGVRCLCWRVLRPPAPVARSSRSDPGLHLLVQVSLVFATQRRAVASFQVLRRDAVTEVPLPCVVFVLVTQAFQALVQCHKK